MDLSDCSPESVMNMLRRARDAEQEKYSEREERDTIEMNKKLMEIQSLHDKQSRIKENINKNLKSLLVQKHGLQKVIQGTDSKTLTLPVTHKYQQDAINFVSDAINFVNNIPVTQESVEPENNIDEAKLCREIITCGESVSQELNRAKTRVDQVETLRENAGIIKSHCFLACDEDQGLIG